MGLRVVAGDLPRSNLSFSITRIFGAVNPAKAVFPAIAAFPPNAVMAAKGSPSVGSAGVAEVAGALTTESVVADGAGAATTGSAVAAALCRFCFSITRCLLKSNEFPEISRKKRSFADSCISTSYSKPFASHSFFMSAMH